MIPKIIHYVWVGNSPKSDLVLKCIESWKKYCPDYKIREWNNDDVVKIDNSYVREAFECKKWAFVSDYLRLYALKTQGGFYFDTDLEVTQSIEAFRSEEFITGYENWNGRYSPITAFMGAEKNNKIISDLFAEYDNLHFIVNGKMDQTTNTARISEYLRRNFNLKTPYNGAQKTELCDKHTIYPSYYFCTPENSKENYSIHHFNGSWLDPAHKKAYLRKEYLKIGRFKLVRFKKKHSVEGKDIPLQDGEKILFSFNFSHNKKICLLRKVKK